MIRVILATVLGLTLHHGEARAATFLDEIAWHNAVVDLGAALGPGQRPRSAPIVVRVVSYEDGYGTFTDPSELAFAGTSNEDPGSVWSPRGGGIAPSPGSFGGSLGCVSWAYPCLGAWKVTLAFDQPVFGFSGQLDYRVYYNADDPEQVLPFFEGTLGYIGPHYGYNGFFGVLAPMRELSLTFYEGWSLDDGVSLSFSGMMLVAAVSEPGGLPLFAAGLMLLGLTAAVRRPRLNRSAGSR